MSPGRRLLAYLLRYRRAFGLGLLCVVASSAFSLASPWVLKYAVDDLTASVTIEKVSFYAVGLLALAAAGGIFRFLQRRIIIGASRDIEYDLRNDFFAHLQRMDLAWFQRHRTGDLMSRATSDLNSVRMMIGPAVMYTSTTALTFVVAIALMVSIHPWLTLLALLPLPLVSVSVYYFGGIIHRRSERIQEQMAEISAIAQEALSGVRVVRAYGQEPHEVERFRRANDEYVKRNRALIQVQGMYYPTMGYLMGVGALLVLWLGSREVVVGRLTVGELVAFNAYLMLLSWPMIAFGWVTNMLQRGMASWKRMLEILDAEPAIDGRGEVDPRTGSPLEALQPIRGEIEFRNLTFAYPSADGRSERAAIRELPATSARDALREVGEDVSTGALDSLSDADAGAPEGGEAALSEVNERVSERAPHDGGRPVLRSISAVIPAGTITAIVGPTGSGKSTLLALLPRLYDPPPGTVFIDGRDVREIPLDVLRGAIGFVPQEPFLFGATIAENVALGLTADGPAKAGRYDSPLDDPAIRARVLEAARIARLDVDVAEFPRGYDTVVGERGITLSGGQKQRTAIARAVAIDPPILVLDDALSAVDTYTEEEILRRLRDVMRQRTAIIVSHRVSTVRDADQILVLVDGTIVERGTHDELVAADGHYAELYRKQLLEEELAAS